MAFSNRHALQHHPWFGRQALKAPSSRARLSESRMIGVCLTPNASTCAARHRAFHRVTSPVIAGWRTTRRSPNTGCADVLKQAWWHDLLVMGPQTTQPVAGELQVFTPASRLLLTVFTGHVGREASEAARARFLDLIAKMDRPVWVSDATALTGFEPSTLALGASWFSAFRERGGRHCLVVSRWDVAMMAARTMALGIGVRVANFATLEGAMARAKNLLVEP